MGKHKDIDDPPIARERWWGTYNAAVGGMLSSSGAPRLGLVAVHDRAVKLADLAHGPVVQPFTPVTPAPETP